MSKRTISAYWEEKRNRWRIDVQKNGIRKTFYSSSPGRQGKRECHEKADAWLDEGIVDARKKVRNMAEDYMEDLKLTTSQSHWRQYDNYIRNYIIPRIGNVHMEDISEQHLQMVINKAYEKGLAEKTLKNIRACEMNFLKFCRKAKATTLFCEDLRIPKGAHKSEKNILQPDDLKILFSHDTITCRGKEIKELYIHAFRFAVVTGLRPGEIIGLQRRDITDGIVHITRAINYYGETTPGKNDNARRTFELHPLAKKILADQSDMLAQMGILSPYVFPSATGSATRQQTYAKHLRRFCEEYNITATTPYELRHTFVSVAKSIDTGLLKSIVGHSADMDTLGIYGHELDGDMTKAANEINALFADILGA